MIDLPVLLILFNRPEKTSKLLDRIKLCGINQLYVFQDGPRKGNSSDSLKCTEVYKLVEEYESDNPVEKLIAEKNLGCGLGPVTAINWFFSHVEYGVILEDDCIPADDFFRFQMELLEKYKDDFRVMQISGFTVNVEHNFDYDYFFSKYYFCYGWGTWRRAWNFFEFRMDDLLPGEINEIVKNYYPFYQQYRLEMDKFSKLPSCERHVWDYHWWFCCYAQNGLCICPKESLIENIGFDCEATHTKTKTIESDMRVGSIEGPIRHPKYIFSDGRILSKIALKNLRKRTIWGKLTWFFAHVYGWVVDFFTVNIRPR